VEINWLANWHRVSPAKPTQLVQVSGPKKFLTLAAFPGKPKRFSQRLQLQSFEHTIALKEISETLTVNTKMYLSKLTVTIFKDKKIKYIIITN